MPTDALRISGLDLDISDFARIAHRFGLSSEVYLSVLSVLSSFFNIGVLSACFKFACYLDFDNALLKLCNIKYAIRYRFSFLIILTCMSEVKYVT